MNIVKSQHIKLIHRNLLHSYTLKNEKKLETEIKETISFTTTTKRIKYLEINLNKETKNLYVDNYKTLMKETKDDTKRWRDIPCSWIGKINIVKMIILLKATYRFNAIIPVKLPMIFFTEPEKKFHNLYEKTLNSQRNLEKEKRSWREPTFPTSDYTTKLQSSR